MTLSALFTYEHLRFIWWLLLGVLLAGFAIMDGFDFGVIALLHYVARTDEERRITLNTVGPVWESNQTWLILGAGAIFAAWPTLYAVSFSGFFWAMLLVLTFLILRPVAFKYRSKLESPTWRKGWDLIFALCGVVPAVVFGIAVGNALLGIPFYFSSEMEIYNTGSFWALLNPFALLCGLLSLAMMLMHGAVFLCIKTQNLIQKRAHRAVIVGAWSCFILFALGSLWIKYGIQGYSLLAPMLHDAPSNPLYKKVGQQLGGWMNNFTLYPLIWIAPLTCFVSLLLTLLLTKVQRYGTAFISSALALLSIVFTVGFTMFPFLLPSSSHPDMSLTVWDASSSRTTLYIMFWSTLFLLPIVLTYVAWAYRVMRGKVNAEYLKKESSSY